MFTNGNFKLYYSGMNEEREKRFQPKLPGLETHGLYEKIGIENPVLVPQVESDGEEETKPVKPVQDEPDSLVHKALVPDLTIIHEDKEERDEMYRRN